MNLVFQKANEKKKINHVYQGGGSEQLCQMLLLKQVRGGLRIDRSWEAEAAGLAGVHLSENRKCGIEQNKYRQIISRASCKEWVKEWVVLITSGELRSQEGFSEKE